MWKIVGVFALLTATIIANAAFKNGRFNFSSLPPKIPTVSIDNHSFRVEIAKTQQQKEIGLSEKNSLPEANGMFFPFDHADYYAFWMKNMKFPIDIIYIHGKHVVTIYSLKNPTSTDTWQIVKPTEPSDSVLEINAGLAKKYNFTVGDEVKELNL